MLWRNTAVYMFAMLSGLRPPDVLCWPGSPGDGFARAQPTDSVSRLLVACDKASQKPIIIGKDGEKLKSIGTQARKDMEKLFGGKVFVEMWVRVRSGWADDEAHLRSYGYE